MTPDPVSRPADTASPSALTGQRRPQAVVVPRRAALQRLQEASDRHLVVVTGPAGYGKTTLLRQYADYRVSQGDSVAWARVDSLFTDPAQLLKLLYDAFNELTQPAGSGRARRPASRLSLPELGDLLRQVRTRGVIFIDNYEQGDEPGLENLLSQLVRMLPAGLQLCIGARGLSTARLSALKLNDDALVLGEDELRFQAAETRDFFAEFSGMSATEIDEIHRGTDGWPAALQCFRLCLRRGRQHRSAAYAGNGVTPELLDFLAIEVFENLDAGMQQALLDLCLPETLNAELAEQLTGAADGQALLTEIEGAGLFLASVDLHGSWYRFHNLFRSFLLTRLSKVMPADSLRARHEQIAVWHAGRGKTEQAIQHYLDAGDSAAAARLFDSRVADFLAEERLGLIEHYANQIPRPELLRYENLVDAVIIAYSFRRAFGKARALLDDIRRQAAAGHGGHDFAETFILAAEDRIEALGEQATAVGPKLRTGQDFRYAITLNARAMWHYGRSEFDTARDLLVEARPLHDMAHSLFGQAYQEAIYSTLLSAQGRVTDALTGLSAALHRTERETMGSASAGSVLAAYLADGLYETNQIDLARQLIGDYGQFAEQQAIVDPLAVMMLTEARIARLDRNQRLAEDSIERLIYLGHRYKLTRLVAYGNAELLRYATLDGDLERAGRRIDMLDDGREGLDSELLFHAGETEYSSVTHCRWLIAVGRHAEARGTLQREIRQAHGQRRLRRELKLLLLLATVQRARHDSNSAYRSLLRALEIAAPQGFIRSFLDEGPALVRLLRDLRESLPSLPRGVEPDQVVRHLDQLLIAAGETPAQSPTQQGTAPHEAGSELLESLTPRELDILRQVARGLTNRDLADRLCVSTNTVKWHLRNIFGKLQIRNRVQAIAVARNLGIIE